MTESRKWTITIPAPCAWLTANNTHRMYVVQNKLIRAWRGGAYYAAMRAKLPTGLERVRIEGIVQFRGRPAVRDHMNLWPTFKAVIDGLGPANRSRRTNGIGYGLITDDDDKHLEGPTWVIGDRLPASPFASPGDLVLIITEVAATNGASLC